MHSRYIDCYYAQTANPAPARPTLLGDIETDVCVIGGGLAGLNTALGLLERGRQAVVVEAERIAWGASGRNGGFVGRGFPADHDRVIKRIGLDQVRKLQSLTVEAVDLIRRHGMTNEVTITSFQRVRLEETRAYAPELPAGWLVPEATDAVVKEARAMGLRQLCPKASTVTVEVVRRLHAEGFLVRAWGVATEDLMRQVVDAGADGMTVNFPDKLIAHLRGTG